MHLINFVSDNPITIEGSSSGYSATVANVSKLNSVTKGQGVFSLHYSPKWKEREEVPTFTSEFSMKEETPVDTVNRQFSDGVCEIALPEPDSCTGFVSSNMEGFIVAPAILLKFRDGREIVIMLFTPRKDEPTIALAKTGLAITGGKVEARVFLSVAEGVKCSGTVSGTGFKKAQLILTRRPNCRVVMQQFSETLCEIKGPGSFASSWMPVSRTFDDALAIFRPSEFLDSDLERVLQLIGANDDTFLGRKNSSFIIGDGAGTSYTLSLVLDRSLRREMMDETLITLS